MVPELEQDVGQEADHVWVARSALPDQPSVEGVDVAVDALSGDRERELVGRRRASLGASRIDFR